MLGSSLTQVCNEVHRLVGNSTRRNARRSVLANSRLLHCPRKLAIVDPADVRALVTGLVLVAVRREHDLVRRRRELRVGLLIGHANCTRRLLEDSTLEVVDLAHGGVGHDRLAGIPFIAVVERSFCPRVSTCVYSNQVKSSSPHCADIETRAPFGPTVASKTSISGAERPTQVPSSCLGPGWLVSSVQVQRERRWPGRKDSLPSKRGSPLVGTGPPGRVWLARVPSSQTS